jgi:sulfate adenylyltransferase (ADP) / ATP adenylyltransferase
MIVEQVCGCTTSLSTCNKRYLILAKIRQLRDSRAYCLEHQSQQSPLFPSDLVAAYRLLVAGRQHQRPFWAFYNCGDLSGASQHRALCRNLSEWSSPEADDCVDKHLQFMPSQDLDGPPIERLARSARLETPGLLSSFCCISRRLTSLSLDRPFTLTSLPYANHVIRFPPHLPSASPAEQAMVLSECFISLLDLAISTVRHYPDYPTGSPSYNVILTLEHLHVIPRKQENAILAETGDPISINSVGFSGQLLVKSEQELDALLKEVSAGR